MTVNPSHPQQGRSTPLIFSVFLGLIWSLLNTNIISPSFSILFMFFVTWLTIWNPGKYLLNATESQPSATMPVNRRPRCSKSLPWPLPGHCQHEFYFTQLLDSHNVLAMWPGSSSPLVRIQNSHQPHENRAQQPWMRYLPKDPGCLNLQGGNLQLAQCSTEARSQPSLHLPCLHDGPSLLARLELRGYHPAVLTICFFPPRTSSRSRTCLYIPNQALLRKSLSYHPALVLSVCEHEMF